MRWLRCEFNGDFEESFVFSMMVVELLLTTTTSQTMRDPTSRGLWVHRRWDSCTWLIIRYELHGRKANRHIIPLAVTFCADCDRTGRIWEMRVRKPKSDWSWYEQWISEKPYRVSRNAIGGSLAKTSWHLDDESGIHMLAMADNCCIQDTDPLAETVLHRALDLQHAKLSQSIWKTPFL